MITKSTRPTIGILLISTWKYNSFVKNIISDIKKYFLPGYNIKIFLHTDQIIKKTEFFDHVFSTKKSDIYKTLRINHKPWPLITLFRYKTFLDFKDQYDTDYLFYLDVDVKINSYIRENILHDFCVVEHYAFKNQRGTPETNPNSNAYIPDNQPITYVAGGFLGGKKDIFLEAAKIIDIHITDDYNRGIIARWHDESHLNRYYVDNKEKIVLLDSCYLSKKSKDCKNPKIIPFHDNEKGFNKFDGCVSR